jgi:hypothetical protein
MCRHVWEVDAMTDDSTTGQGAPAERGAKAAAKQDADSVMGLLAEHVPLALLADLAVADGPVSQEILETEGLPADAWWETGDDELTPDAAGH